MELLDTKGYIPAAPRGWMVYAWVPVNVKVKASTREKAEELALDALSRSRPLELTTDDDSLPIYLDGGVPAMIDKKSQAQELDTEDMEERAREYAAEEAA